MRRSSLTHEKVFNDIEFAERYARRHKRMAKRFGEECAANLSLRGFKQGRIIDVGCGSGDTAICLARNFPGSEVFGIDLSEPLLRLAHKSAHAAGLGNRVKFEKADVHEIPYDYNFFDAVMNINMVHLAEDPVRMLNEMERVLVPDGFLFIADLRRSWLGLIEHEINAALTADEAKALLSQSALRDGCFSHGLLWWRFEG